ncbi:MAG: glycosyltransferase family 2 protein [Leucobacter sp.]|nr:glycosyltransferase family 2 protein [Leucobacter sp.]
MRRPFFKSRSRLQTSGGSINDYVGLVIAYRNHDLVGEVLARLSAQTVLPRLVLVVDNGGTLTDAVLRDLIEADHPDFDGAPLGGRVQLISLPDNPGYGAAVNAARPHLGESALLVLTHDAVFGTRIAERLLTTLTSSPDDVGCAAPLLRFASDPDRVFSAGGRLTAGGRAYHLSEPLSSEPYPVDWGDGAIAMYSAAALEHIGWLAEEYFLYFEDVDTGWRLRQAGLSSVIVPDEIAFQQPGAHPMYLGIRNMTLFAKKAGIDAVRQFGSMLLRTGRESIGRLRRGRPLELGAAWRGWRDGRAGRSGKPHG